MHLVSLYHRALRHIAPASTRSISKHPNTPFQSNALSAQPATDAPLADSSNEYMGPGGDFGHEPLPAPHTDTTPRPKPPEPTPKDAAQKPRVVLLPPGDGPQEHG